MTDEYQSGVQEGRILEKLDNIEKWLKKMCGEFDKHMSDHEKAIQKAEEAHDTAKQAALYAQIQHRGNRIQFWAPIIASVLVVVGDIVLKVTGH